MTKFVVLYSADVSAEDQLQQQSEEEAAAGTQAWLDWSATMGGALIDFGQPLGNGRTVTAGGTAPTAGTVGGYSIIEAADADAAVGLLQGHPHLKRGTIEVYEAFPIPGM